MSSGRLFQSLGPATVVHLHTVHILHVFMFYRDRIRDTLNVPLDHTFGYYPPPEKHGMGELLHMRPDSRVLRGRTVDRSAVAVIRNHLKKANFHAFDNLLHAFKFYDKVLRVE